MDRNYSIAELEQKPIKYQSLCTLGARSMTSVFPRVCSSAGGSPAIAAAERKSVRPATSSRSRPSGTRHLSAQPNSVARSPFCGSNISEPMLRKAGSCVA